MHSQSQRIVLFIAVVLGIAGLCVLSVNHQVNDVQKAPPPRLHYTVAEGLRLWNPKTGVDIVRFESCNVQKMKIGFLALGAFNVLCIKGLVLNLPLEEDETGDENRGSGDGDEAIATLLPKSLMERTGLISKRFSGIKVDDLRVNRIANGTVVPVFAAETLNNQGKILELTNCRVFADDGTTNLVGRATLKLKPVPALVWDGGEQRLDDLLK